jgi:hypothetical protein
MSKETAEHFIKNVVKTYQEARELAFPDIHNKVERGRNHTVASKIEDLLAITIQTKLNRHHTFKVDQPLSIEGKTFYPDIVVIRKGQVVHLLDLKMDLGWNRNGFTDFCKKADARNIKHQGKIAVLKNGRTKIPGELKIAPDCKHHVVVVSSTNISKEKFEKHIAATNKLKSTKVYTLSHEVHPNTYRKPISDIIIDTNAFNSLIRNLKQ